MKVGSNVRDKTAIKTLSGKHADGRTDPFQGTANYQYASMTEKEFEEFAMAKRKAMFEQKG